MLEELLSDLKPTDIKIIECTALAPYSGCWREPNYWIYHKDKIHPLYVSGKALKFSGEETIKSGITIDIFCNQMDTYHMWYEDFDIWDFAEVNWNPNVINCATVICHAVTGGERDKDYKPYLPRWKCSICFEECVGIAHFLGYRGNGGVGIELLDPCCSDCFNTIKHCNHCYNYVVPVYPEETISESQLVLNGVDMEREFTEADLECPNCKLDEDQEQQLSDPVDEASNCFSALEEILGLDVEELVSVSMSVAQTEVI